MDRPVIELVDEFRLSPARAAAIRRLLHACFPDDAFTTTRTYLKQVPARRLLATQGGELVGHVGIEHRVVGTSTGPANIFGIRACMRATASSGPRIRCAGSRSTSTRASASATSRSPS